MVKRNGLKEMAIATHASRVLQFVADEVEDPDFAENLRTGLPKPSSDDSDSDSSSGGGSLELLAPSSGD